MAPRRMALRAWVCVNLIALGVLAGALTDRARFEQRRARMLERYREALARNQAQLLGLEGRGAPAVPGRR